MIKSIKLHNRLSVPERVISKVSESRQPALTPDWLSSLPMLITAALAGQTEPGVPCRSGGEHEHADQHEGQDPVGP